MTYRTFFQSASFKHYIIDAIDYCRACANEEDELIHEYHNSMLIFERAIKEYLGITLRNYYLLDNAIAILVNDIVILHFDFSSIRSASFQILCKQREFSWFLKDHDVELINLQF